MMRVTVELCPYGDSTKRRELLCLDISNVSGLSAVSDYKLEGILNVGQKDQQDVLAFVLKHNRADLWPQLVSRAMGVIDKQVKKHATESMVKALGLALAPPDKGEESK